MSDMTKEELEIELGRAYRAIVGLFSRVNKDDPANASVLGYHVITIAAAKRFIYEEEMSGTEYFIGKHHEVLTEALKLPAGYP